jgi:capsular polysaccharide biosynthesis protein
MKSSMPIGDPDDVTFFDYWDVLRRRRAAILAVCVLSALVATLVSLLLPKTFRGEVVLAIPAQVTQSDLPAAEFISVMGSLKGEKLHAILPRTYQAVAEIRLSPLEDSDSMLRMVIDARTPEDVSRAVTDFTEYVNTKTYVSKDIHGAGIRPTGEILVTSAPVKPDIRLNVLMAVSIGLFAAVVWAFVSASAQAWRESTSTA